MNPKTLVTVHGYAGDQQQIKALLPAYEHHNCPILLLGCENSPVESIPPHLAIQAGKQAYVGQDSWDRQYAQIQAIADYMAKNNLDWVLMNDSDSFVLTPELPAYLYENDNAFYSNQVSDFRVPGGTWTDANGSVTWPLDYHQGYPLLAMQPPYFTSRVALNKILATCQGLQACPTTPFIDWMMVVCAVKAGLAYKAFQTGASCETVTPNGIAVMTECIVKRGATFIHSVKNKETFDNLRLIHEQVKG